MTQTLQWGWLSHFASQSLLINARADSLLSKSLYRGVQPIAIPALAFWERGRRFGLPDDEPFALAGVSKNGQFLVVTVDANAQVRPVHHRMPVVLREGEWQQYLTTPTIRWLLPYAAPLVA